MNCLDILLRITVLIAFFVQQGTAVAAPSEAPPESLAELKRAIVSVIAEHQVPAVGIAMVDENGPVWIGALGKADLEKDIDADENTLFRIGSTSKMFVALAILQLVEQGSVSLNDKVADLAPDVVFENPWEETDPVRVVHLLEHTTGWDDIHLPEYAHNDPKPASLKEGLDFHPHSRISRWVPGSRMSYCNSGPPVAARIVEHVTGQDFEEYVQDNFFEPMGMASATYRLSEDVMARGVTSYANGNQPQEYWHISMRPSGSINASPADMARLVEFFLARGAVNGRQLVSPASLERMETPGSSNAAIAGMEAGYGLHNYSSPYKAWVYREHNGGVNGGISEFAYLPQAGLGHAIMMNSDAGAAFRQISNLVRGYETRNLEKVEFGENQQPGAANRGIEGYYFPINPRQQVAYFLERVFNVQEFRFEQDMLSRKGLFDTEAKFYFPLSDGLYASSETGMVSLASVHDPIAGAVVHVGTTVLKPVSPALVFGQLGIVVLWVLFIASSILFLPIWMIRRVRGKIPAGGGISVRIWPLLASASIVVLVALFMLGMSDPFELLGAPTAVSVGVMLATLAFAFFAVAGVFSSFKTRRTPMNRFAWWHSTAGSVLHFVVAAYLALFGIIGLMTWA